MESREYLVNKYTRIYQGDCLNIMPNIKSNSVDMVLCDLPYGRTNNHWDKPINLTQLWEQYERIIKDNGVICLFAQTPFDKILGVSNLKLLRYEWIWEKSLPTGFLNSKKMPMKAHENILVFYKKLPIYNPQKTKGHKEKISKAIHKVNCKKSTNYQDYKLTSYKSTERFPRSVLRFSSVSKTIFPTQKPVELCEYLIKTYTNEGMVVLDNCMGSGTTGIAANNLRCKFIGIEKDKNIFSIAKKRLEEYSTDYLDNKVEYDLKKNRSYLKWD